MENLLTQTIEQLLSRPAGPLHLRFVLQPTVAAIIAIRAGLRDCRQRQPPYLSSVFFQSEMRRGLLASGWRDIGKVFIVAVVLDAAYQLIEFRWLYPGQAIIVAVVLAIVPYALIRGPVSRCATFLRTRRARSKLQPG